MNLQSSARVLAFLTTFTTAVSACSSGGGVAPTPSTSSSGPSGAGGAPTVGEWVPVIEGDRPVEVYVPTSYKTDTPMPLVILLHGYSASGGLQEIYLGIKPFAEARGFLYAHPDGLVNGNDKQYWNATDACCDFEKSNVDDSAYLKSVIDGIKAAYNVDSKRIFLFGHSNGGFMSYRMACDHADSIAAIASLAGAMFIDPSKCNPEEPVAVLQIHGTKDETISYNGGMEASFSYPSAKTSVEDWAKLDGCSLTPKEQTAELDLETSLSGAETDVALYAEGCKPGGHAELWSIQGGSHLPAISNAFTPGVLDFLFAHPKP